MIELCKAVFLNPDCTIRIILRALKKIQMTEPHPDQLSQNGEGRAQASVFFKEPPGEADVQPG